MIWTLAVDKAVKKTLQNIPQKDAGRIYAAIQELGVNPYAGDIRRMSGQADVWRRRVGAYRIFYEVMTAKKFIYVYEVKRRTSTTY